ncbi:FAD-binding protein [Sagittula stellata]|uniref:Uncharacterized protein n=1 Tax=Sagittula stellata (strain ATCC 700073 / DSM 11524 / E-37) TaxID=388399 RepID=A3K738_SAGS3|nr:FAD-binding protein [Sagittula stellata]EBA07165.1 hypothetical protein SSE37_13246 [Sagittula stellata E-37]
MSAGIPVTEAEALPFVDHLLGISGQTAGRVSYLVLASVLAGSGSIANELSSIRSQVTRGLLAPSTWAELEALTGSEDAAGAEVPLSDEGTHSQATETGYDGDTVSNHGRYKWSGAWSRWVRIGEFGGAVSDVVVSLSGTANALSGSSDRDHSKAPYAAKFVARVVDINTGAVTIGIDGGTARALVTNTGAELQAGELLPGMVIEWRWNGEEYRLIPGISVASMVQRAEDARDAAESSAGAALVSETNSAASAAAAASSALSASAYKNAAQAASEASGDVLFYDTMADADAALGGLSENQIVRIFSDEGRRNRQTFYRVESSALVFKWEDHRAFVFLEDFGGAGDGGTTNNSVALQAIVDAHGASGVTVVLSQDSGDAAGGNWKNAPNAYVFNGKVTLPITSRLELIAQNNAVIRYEPASVGDGMLEVQAGSAADHASLVFRGLKVDLLADEGRFLTTVATGVTRIREFLLADCQFKADNYVVDMKTDYTYNPVIENVNIIGARSGFRWRGYGGINFVTSSACISGLHIQTSGGPIRGPMLWLEGWGGLSGKGNILEGSAKKDVTGTFENVGYGDGVSVSTLFLENCSTFREVEFSGHSELVHKTHADGTDYDIYISNPATSNRQDFNVRLGGGFEHVDPARIKLDNNISNEGGVLRILGGSVADAVDEHDMDGPVRLEMTNGVFGNESFKTHPLFGSPFIEYIGTRHGSSGGGSFTADTTAGSTSVTGVSAAKHFSRNTSYTIAGEDGFFRFVSVDLVAGTGVLNRAPANTAVGVTFSQCTFSANFKTPALLAYSYKGGWLGSDAYPIIPNPNVPTSADGPERYVHNDPYFGPTLVYRSEGTDIGISNIPIHRPGEVLTAFTMVRGVMAAPPYGSATWNVGSGTIGDNGLHGSGAMGVRIDQLTENDWMPIMSQVRILESQMRNGAYLDLRLAFPNGAAIPWMQMAAFSLFVGKGWPTGDVSPSGKNFVCHEDPYYNVANGFGPAQGTVIVGDTVISKGYSSDYVDRWVCTVAGTSRAISTTASTTSGSTAVTFADATKLIVGDYITIAGVTGVKRVMALDYAAGTGVIDSNADATVSGAACANSAPTWEARCNGKLQVAAVSPVGSVTPVAVGQMYRNSSSGTIYLAYGLASAGWVALN